MGREDQSEPVQARHKAVFCGVYEERARIEHGQMLKAGEESGAAH
jgi:hypothetical protein